jgi:hypothetical protein
VAQLVPLNKQFSRRLIIEKTSRLLPLGGFLASPLLYQPAAAGYQKGADKLAQGNAAGSAGA